MATFQETEAWLAAFYGEPLCTEQCCDEVPPTLEELRRCMCDWEVILESSREDSAFLASDRRRYQAVRNQYHALRKQMRKESGVA